jgi:broad specificity phosphatase PhoE
MTRLPRRHLGESIAIVSHGALLTTFIRQLQGISLNLVNHFAVPNGSISHVRFHSSANTWTIIIPGFTLQPVIPS